ncbi:Fc.00g013920.m01.CDS01 [Cosmosporella sp. VM-42]
MPELRLDPEYWKATAPFRSGQKPAPWKTVLKLREFTNSFMPVVMSNVPDSPCIKEVFKIKSYDGAEVIVTRFANDSVLNTNEPTPAVIYGHGGGMIGGSVDIFAPQIAISPISPFFYAALKYVSEYGKKFNIDTTKIVVMGDSAGAGIAASGSPRTRLSTRAASGEADSRLPHA